MTQIGFPYLGESNCDMCSEIVNFVRWKLAFAGFEGNIPIVWSWLSEDSSMFVDCRDTGRACGEIPERRNPPQFLTKRATFQVRLARGAW
jgi:hypothetical protein